MGRDSAIEWTHHTFNPWRGCTKVSAGCAHCYAETQSKRNPKVLGIWGKDGARVIASDAYWRQPLIWNAEAQEANERRRVFCASLADVGEGIETMPLKSWPKVQAARAQLCDTIERTPWLDWLLLTKRPGNMPNLFPKRILECCWVGASVENQEAADLRIRQLQNCPAKIRFLSGEPLLGDLNLRRVRALGVGYFDALDGRGHDGSPTGGKHFKDDSCGPSIDWVIVGGESGGGARPMHPKWVTSIRDQCREMRVPFFFKQWGEWEPVAHSEQTKGDIIVDPRSGKIRNVAYPSIIDAVMRRVGKKVAGRRLDGREWSEFPKVQVMA